MFIDDVPFFLSGHHWNWVTSTRVEKAWFTRVRQYPAFYQIVKMSTKHFQRITVMFLLLKHTWSSFFFINNSTWHCSMVFKDLRKSLLFAGTLHSFQPAFQSHSILQAAGSQSDLQNGALRQKIDVRKWIFMNITDYSLFGDIVDGLCSGAMSIKKIVHY